MTTITKILGVSFLLTFIFGAIIIDLLNWPNIVYAVPVIGLEIVFFVSLIRDAALEEIRSY